MKAYCAKSPKGKLIPDSCAALKSEAIRYLINGEFYEWKELKRQGWTIVEVEIREKRRSHGKR